MNKKRTNPYYSYGDTIPPWTDAVTIKKIEGTAIKTIPAGTAFKVNYMHGTYSMCTGLPGICSVWNDEFHTEGTF